VTVTTQLTWNNSGTMKGTGITVLAATATMSLGGDGTNEFLDTRTFNNAGKANWLASSGGFGLYNDATFNNQSGGVFTISCDQPFFSSGVTGQFNNLSGGTFTKSAGAGTTTFSGIIFNNAGTVNVNSGILAMNQGGTSTGSWVLAGGTKLTFSGFLDNLNSATTSITGNGSVLVSGGEVDFGGTYNINGDTTISSGSAMFLNGGSTGTFTNSGGTVTIGSGTTFSVTSAINGNYSQTSGTTFLNGGTISVPATFSVNIGSGTSFAGPGTINGAVANSGNLYAGGGSIFVGLLTINGNYSQTSTGTLFINIGGLTAVTQYDQLKISGTATLAGTLTITLQGGFVPSSGNTFTIMTYASESGDFTTKNLGGLTSATPGATTYVATK
jgi:hypothetical protein